MFSLINHTQSSREIFQKPFHETELKFRPGDIFKGTIIQKRPGGEVLVAARGKQFLAKTELNLSERWKYRFQVKSTGARIELKVLDSSARPPSSSDTRTSSQLVRGRLANILVELAGARDSRGLPELSRQALRNLNKLLPAMIYDNPSGNNFIWLSRHLLGSGIFWENKVAQYVMGEKSRSWKMVAASDLKGILLSLEKSLKSGGHIRPDHKPIILKLKQAIHMIEQDQFMNIASIKEDIGWFWFIPGHIEDGFKGAEIFTKKRNKGEEVCFSMLLEFTDLGRMEISVSLIQSTLGIKILVEDTEKSEFVNRHLPLLAEGLRETGMGATAISCDVKEMEDHEIFHFSDGKNQSSTVHLII